MGHRPTVKRNLVPGIAMSVDVNGLNIHIAPNIVACRLLLTTFSAISMEIAPVAFFTRLSLRPVGNGDLANAP